MDTGKGLFFHLEMIVLFLTLIGGFYMLDNKIESQCGIQTARVDQVNARTDQLYQMFIELLKENKAS